MIKIRPICASLIIGDDDWTGAATAVCVIARTEIGVLPMVANNNCKRGGKGERGRERGGTGRCAVNRFY